MEPGRVAADRGGAGRRDGALLRCRRRLGRRGPKWRRVDFTVPVSGQSTLRLSWTGTADMRFTVFDAATGRKLGENLTTANPKSVTLNLQAGVAYYSGVWAASGAGSYTYVLVQGTTSGSATAARPSATPTSRPRAAARRGPR